MNVVNLGKGFSLLKQLIDPTVSTQSVITTPPSKPEFTPQSIEKVITSPEASGIPSEHIEGYIKELYNNKEVGIQNLIITRNSKTIIEADFDCWNINVWKNTFSECKSITSLAIGMLLEDRVLTPSESLVDIFGKKVPPLVKGKFKDITVIHLLTMSTQVMFNEAECMTTENWIKGFFNSGSFSEMGKGFFYNSLNSYMLSAVVTEKTGMAMSDFLKKRLFDPLGITEYHWEKCPRGIDKGGWGLYILPRDMVKLGQLILNEGRWKDKQLISRKYLSAATKGLNKTSEAMGSFDYGFQIWSHRTHNCFLFNGMLGQNMLCFPESGVIVAVNAGNADTFQQNAFFEITHRYFAEGFKEQKLPENRKAFKQLKKTLDTLSHFRPRRNKHLSERIFRKKNIEKNSRRICGNYAVTSKEAASVSILPLMMQVVQNNYTKGTLGYSFLMDEKGLCLSYIEKGSQKTSVHIGFDAPFVEQIAPLGEKCLVATTGEFRYNEDDLLVLKVRIDFLEYPYTRRMKFIFSGNGLKVIYDENPGRRLIDNFDTSAIMNLLPSWLSNLTSQGVENFAAKIASAFEETLYAQKE